MQGRGHAVMKLCVVGGSKLYHKAIEGMHGGGLGKKVGKVLWSQVEKMSVMMS